MEQTTLKDLEPMLHSVTFIEATPAQIMELLTGAEIMAAVPMSEPESYCIYFTDKRGRKIVLKLDTRNGLQGTVARGSRRRGADEIFTE